MSATVSSEGLEPKTHGMAIMMVMPVMTAVVDIMTPQMMGMIMMEMEFVMQVIWMMIMMG